MQRYPEDTIATIEDFRSSGWREAIDSSSRMGYSAMWQALSQAARAAIDDGQLAQGKVLWILADACSMTLKPEGMSDPFRPKMIMDGRRSALPEDFQDLDVSLLAEVAGEVDNPWLQARLADLVWLLKMPRSPRHATMAIDAYRKISLDAETWLHDGEECWERAIALARLLGRGAGERLYDMEAAIVSAFEAANKQDGFLALWLSDLLFKNRLAREMNVAVGDRLASLARLFESEGDLHRARDFFRASSKWFKRAGNNGKAVEMIVGVAELWVKMADAQLSSDQPSNLVAAGFYENAIQSYRAIPRSQRSLYNVERRISEIHRRMSEAGEGSLDELGVISAPAIDISEMVKGARRAVAGKSVIDALAAFSIISHGFREEKLRQTSEEFMREFPFQTLLSATHLSSDGRVVARRPGIGSSDVNSSSYQVTLRAEMVKNYGMEIGLVVQGQIWPALEVLHLEHRVREADFVTISHQSPIVPKNRARILGKGLYLGYEKDFVGALHLLIPQIEHMVRWHLKVAGVKTTTIDTNGIENENGLSTLMDLPEVAQIFGQDLAFEFKALFCDAFGPNLRNRIAHGLLEYEACQSVHSIYAWWLALKVVFSTFWNARRVVAVEEISSESPEGNSVV